MTIVRAGLVIILAVGCIGTPLDVAALESGGVPRIGVLMANSEQSPWAEAFRQGLRELGWIQGQNIAIEWRLSGRDGRRYPDLAAELVRLKVDVIVAGPNPSIQASHAATGMIPIVMVQASDPVGLGFIASLTRPGGNLTGLTAQSPELAGKRLQLLKETVPNLSRVAILWDPAPGWGRHLFIGAETVAPRLGLQLELVEARNSSDLDSAFATIAKARVGAVFYPGSTMQFAERTRIAEYARSRRLLTMCGTREYVEAGCLMTYAPNFTDLWRHAATFVDKILKGAKPADLPVEQPTKFELVINMKTAKALGLTIPPSLLLRADQVIE